MNNLIYNTIPHRPPFLFIDAVLSVDDAGVVTSYAVQQKDVAGHYPGVPLVPGVLLCEMVFQAAAFYLGRKQGTLPGVPVLSKIIEARFRHTAGPGDVLQVAVVWEESLGGFEFLKGKVSRGTQTLMTLRCALGRRAQL